MVDGTHPANADRADADPPDADPPDADRADADRAHAVPADADRAHVDLERMLDLATPWCLMVAATLRLPDLIAAGHGDIAGLAATAGCDPDALHAVLGHLAAQGVFTEAAPGRFAVNEPARELSGMAQFLDLDSIGGRMAGTWGTLLGYVRTGQSGYAQVFGRPFWEDLDAHPAIAADFDALMGPAGHGLPDFDVELTGGWEPIRTMVDVGGGTGAMLASLLRRHPAVYGTLVDLPGTIARASPTWPAPIWPAPIWPAPTCLTLAWPAPTCPAGSRCPARASSTRCPPAPTCTC